MSMLSVEITSATDDVSHKCTEPHTSSIISLFSRFFDRSHDDGLPFVILVKTNIDGTAVSINLKDFLPPIRYKTSFIHATVPLAFLGPS